MLHAIESNVLKAAFTYGPDPFGTGTKLVRISLVFTRDPMDPVRIGSAILYQMGPPMKVIILCLTVPFQFRTGPV